MTPGRGTNRKGRSKKRGKFVALGEGLITSTAWRSLSGGAIRYYIELRRRFNGMNNGELHLSLEESNKRLGMAKDTAMRAQQELVEKGLIRMTKRGGFHQRLATEWALTDEPTAAVVPSHDYKSWQPPKNASVGKLDPSRLENPTENVVPITPSVGKSYR